MHTCTEEAIKKKHRRVMAASCSNSTGKTGKRKQKVLSIDEKLDICDRLRSSTITALAQELGIGKSIICDIKRSEDKLKCFAAKMDSTEGSLK